MQYTQEIQFINILNDLVVAVENENLAGVNEICEIFESRPHIKRLLNSHYRPCSIVNFVNNNSLNFNSHNKEIFSEKLGVYTDGNPLNISILIGNIEIIQRVSTIIDYNESSAAYILSSNPDVKKYFKKLDGRTAWDQILTFIATIPVLKLNQNKKQKKSI